jgi:hypothetical protein
VERHQQAEENRALIPKLQEGRKNPTPGSHHRQGKEDHQLDHPLQEKKTNQYA